MKDSAKYVKVVTWSEEDQCFVGSAPGLFFGGCHGDDEKEVFHELCQSYANSWKTLSAFIWKTGSLSQAPFAVVT